MKHLRSLTLAVLAIAALSLPFALGAAEPEPAPTLAGEKIVAPEIDFAPAETISAPESSRLLSRGFLAFILAGAISVGMVNARTLRDLNLAKSKALPAAGASVNGDTLDTAFVNPGRIPEGPELLVELPVTPALADTKKITLTVEDSADGVTFAAVADLPVITVGPAAGGTGGAAVARQFKLPITARRYLRLVSAVEAAGGSNIAVSSTLSIVF